MVIKQGKWVGFMVSGALHLGLALLLLSGNSQYSTQYEQQYDLQLSMFQEPLPMVDAPALKESVIDDMETLANEDPVEDPAPDDLVPEPEPLAMPIASPTKSAKQTIEKKIKPQPQKSVKKSPLSMLVTNAAPAQDIGLIASQEAQYQANLYQAIMVKKYYPRRARNLRKQGIVLIAFTIRPDGSFHHLKVIKSSGIDLLDISALNAIQKVGKFPPFPDAIRRSAWTFEIPMEYEIL